MCVCVCVCVFVCVCVWLSCLSCPLRVYLWVSSRNAGTEVCSLLLNMCSGAHSLKCAQNETAFGLKWLILHIQLSLMKSSVTRNDLKMNSLLLFNSHTTICAVLSHFSHVWFFATPWTVAHLARLFMRILQARIQEWLAISSSRGWIFLTQGLNPCLLCILHWQMGSLPLAPPGKPTQH